MLSITVRMPSNDIINFVKEESSVHILTLQKKKPERWGRKENFIVPQICFFCVEFSLRARWCTRCSINQFYKRIYHYLCNMSVRIELSFSFVKTILLVSERGVSLPISKVSIVFLDPAIRILIGIWWPFA